MLNNYKHKERIEQLRSKMRGEGSTGFILSALNEHHSEFLHQYFLRLAWLTGFTGSTGFAIILLDKAALFVDGRYTLQAQQQVDSILKILPFNIKSISTWLKANLKKSDILSYDPWIHTKKATLPCQRACDDIGAKFKPIHSNPIDLLWIDRPPYPKGAVTIQELKYSGQSSKNKRTQLSQKLQNQKVDFAVLTMIDSIAWLLNIRGSDSPFEPLPLAFAYLYKNGTVDLFIDQQKLSATIFKHLGNDVCVKPYTNFKKNLEGSGREGYKVLIDPRTAPIGVEQALKESGAKVIENDDPTILPKACKNTVELNGAVSAHIKDGVVLTTFLAWLEREVTKGEITELNVVDKLLALRSSQEEFYCSSFPTIGGFKEHGAIIHYSASEKTNKVLKHGGMFLIDSGGHYKDGTTDVTRVISLGGSPTEEQKDRYTRVLKGHIALTQAKFPKGTTGSNLDILARYHLWQVGLNYNHGTGHGVGSFSGAHEGPQGITNINHIPLRKGMILSNEPGYYKEGEYGIRIENLVIVESYSEPGFESEMLCFKTITMAPISTNLIDLNMLIKQEIEWLNDYHKKVRETLKPLLDQETAAWLEKATAKINIT